MFDVTEWSQNRHWNGKFLIWLHKCVRTLPLMMLESNRGSLTEVVTGIDPDDCFGWLAGYSNQQFTRKLWAAFQALGNVRRKRPPSADAADWSRTRYHNDKFLVWLHYRIRMLRDEIPEKAAPLTEVLVQIDPEDCRGWLTRECSNQELACELLIKGPKSPEVAVGLNRTDVTREILVCRAELARCQADMAALTTKLERLLAMPEDCDGGV